MTNQLSRNGELLHASQVWEKILRLMTKDFKNILCAIEESKDLSLISIEELVGSLGCTSNGEGRTKSQLIKHFKQSLTWREEHGTLKVEVLVEEAEKTEDEEVEAEKPVCKIGMTEDKGDVEEVDQVSQELSALNVASTTTTTTMQMIVNL